MTFPSGILRRRTPLKNVTSPLRYVLLSYYCFSFISLSIVHHNNLSFSYHNSNRTAPGLVTLCLIIDHPSAYFQPNIPVLLQWISFMPQLENLEIRFTFPVLNRDVEWQLTRTPITTNITLPNLRLSGFRSVSTYLEAVVCRITSPRLEILRIRLFKQLTFSVPRLVRL